MDEFVPVQRNPFEDGREDGRKSRSKWTKLLAYCDAAPGEWFLIAQSVSAGSVAHLRFRYTKHEFKTRSIPGTKPLRIDLYARKLV